MAADQLTKDMTMQELLAVFPGAQRALFSRYHIGGCSSCGFQPTETLEQVGASHNIPDVEEVVGYLEESRALEREIQDPAGGAVERVEGRPEASAPGRASKSVWSGHAGRYPLPVLSR